MSEYSLHLTRTYLVNALRAAQRNRSVRSKLLTWMERNQEHLEIIDVPCLVQKGGTKNAPVRFIKRAIHALEKKTRRPPPPCPDATATRLVVERFSLGPAAASLLELLRSYNDCHLVESMWDELRHLGSERIEATEILLNRSRREVEDAAPRTGRFGHGRPGEISRTLETSRPLRLRL